MANILMFGVSIVYPKTVYSSPNSGRAPRRFGCTEEIMSGLLGCPSMEVISGDDSCSSRRPHLFGLTRVAVHAVKEIGQWTRGPTRQLEPRVQ
jgi:hypothetical protein